MKIYTKAGDKGVTSLFSGDKVLKCEQRINLYGTVDELIAIIVLALEFEPPQRIETDLKALNAALFGLCADVATPFSVGENIDSSKSDSKVKIQRISANEILLLEKNIDEYSSFLPKLTSFIVPGGNKCAAFLNQARTVCRRAERIAVELNSEEKNINEQVISYLNRLSDYFFVAMRYANLLAGNKESTINFAK